MGSLYRSLALAVGGRPAVHRLISRRGRAAVLRFVAGETLDAAVVAVRRLNADGLAVTLDHLGEATDNPARAAEAAGAYVEMLGRIEQEGLNADVSVKLTQFGLALDQRACAANLDRVVQAAAARGNFVWIDMEDSRYTSATLELYRQARAGGGPVAVVIQAYLNRSGSDLAAIARPGAAVRICKGAYAEPPSVAFRSKAEVDLNYRRLVTQLFDAGGYPAIATHDEAMIAWAEALVHERGLAPDRFEFQMLYGVRPALQRALARKGYRVRIYVPFGQEWYPYFVRRLAERPANLGFVLRNLLRA